MVVTALGFLISNTTQQAINFFKFEHVTKYDINFVSTLGELIHQLGLVTVLAQNQLQKVEITPVLLFR